MKFIDKGLLDVFILVFEKYVPTKLIIYNKKIFKLYRKKRRKKRPLIFFIKIRNYEEKMIFKSVEIFFYE